MTVNSFFIRIYDFFHRKKWVLYLLLGIWAVICSIVLIQIRFEEDISNVFPDDPQVQDVNTILKNSPFLKRIYMVVKPADTNKINTDHITDAADLVTEKIQKYGSGYVKKLNSRADDEIASLLMDMVYNNIPFFLDSIGYILLENNLNPDSIHKIFEEGYNQLLSPAGFATKSFFVNDPLGITWKGMKKLNVLNVNQRFTMNDGYLMTKDGHNLMIFIEPSSNSANTSQNKKLVDAIDKSIAEVKNIYPELDIIYFGAPAMSVANAQQIRKDVFLTVGLAFVLLNLILLAYFRKWYAMPLLMAPVFFGATTALTVLVLTRQSISSISLGIGSVMLGLILDFSLHAYTHFRENKSARQMVADISPLLMATSGTTVLTFLCLLVLQSNLLNELGLFAAISVGTAALFTVIVLPHFMGKPLLETVMDNKVKKKNALAGKMKWVSLILIFFLAIPLFFVRKVGFETEMDKFSYTPDKLRDAENYLDEISDFKLKNIYVVSKGKTFQEALEDQQKYQTTFETLKQKNVIDGYTSIVQFWPSVSAQKQLLDKWKAFWTDERKEMVKSSIEKEASLHKFKPNVFDSFYAWINHPQIYSDDQALEVINRLLLGDLIQTSNGEVCLISLIRVSEANKPIVYSAFSKSDLVFDNKFIFNKLHQILQQDFQLLVWLSTILVFCIILLTFRKTELAIVTMIPLILSWFVTLGIMGMIGQQFNIFNVIICTFIFGLGIDYSIFLGKGILDQYRNNFTSLPTFRISIILSLITTLLGMGVLIFAKHPALKSISIVSLIGLFSVAFTAFFLLPFIYNFLFYSSGKPRTVVMSIKNILITAYLLGLYIACGVVLLISSLLLSFFSNGKLILEKQFSLCMKIIVRIAITFKHRNIFMIDPAQFRNTILIMNHQSMIDLVVLGAISGKIRVVTKGWVFNVPIIGKLARVLGFYSLEQVTSPEFIEKVKIDLLNGYTVMFFPEGTRSKDQSISRFKKGAFLLAEQAEIDITPMLITGTGTAMPPGSWIITSGMCAVKVLPKISVHDIKYSSNYSSLSKEICQIMRKEHHLFRLEVENKSYIRNALMPRFRYRKFEVRRDYENIFNEFENISLLNRHLAYNDDIGFIGSGYGALISFLLFSGPHRNITVFETLNDHVAELEFIRNWHSSLKVTDTINDLSKCNVLIVLEINETIDFKNIISRFNGKEFIILKEVYLPSDFNNCHISKMGQYFILKKNGII